MKVTFNYTTDYGKSHTSEVREFDTLEEAFKNLYDSNRHLRYCNGYYYTLEDAQLKSQYERWYNSLSESTKFSMYYGNGIVD